MMSRKSFLFSIVLLLVNTAGAAGALLDSLGMGFGTVLRPGIFLWGMLILCLLSWALWDARGKAEAALRWGLFLAAVFICILAFGKELAEGLGWALQGVFERINERYGIHLIWNLTAEADLAKQSMRVAMSRAAWGVLMAMLPLVLLLGYGVVRQRALALLPANALWFVAACTMDDFPAYIWLVLCILGFGAVVIRAAFRDDERAGMQAVLMGTAVLGVSMALVYRFAVPFLDSRYDAIQEARNELSRKMNEEWIPQIENMLARLGSGSGTDVTGKLTRAAGTVYTSDEIYRVTFSYAPKSTVYLRGFVGKEYAGDEWKAGRDSDMEAYYRVKGWELPGDGSSLVNLTYDAFRYRASEKVRVEELAAAGSYTVYPYGAQLTEDYRVHWDGTAEREGDSWELLYSAPENYSREKKLAGVAAENENRYRTYVYDTFCEYPAEDFPELTEFLENAGFRTGSVYDSVEDVLTYLTGNAVYNLDVPNTPGGKDFVEYFLFESGEGYCAHFASSAVLMLRYLGVPARYVTGYAASPGAFSRNAEGDYSAVILDRQAHAWAEVYLDGIGWIPIEMTPGAAPFSVDNTGEQLALAAQLTGEQGSGHASPSEKYLPEESKNAAGDEESRQEEDESKQEESGSEKENEPKQEKPAGSEKENESNREELAGEESPDSESTAGQGGFGQGSFGGIGAGFGFGSGSGGAGISSGQGSAGGGAGSGGAVVSSGQGNAGGSSGSEGAESFETDAGPEPIWLREIFDGVMTILKDILLAAVLLLLTVILWKLIWMLIRQSCCRKLEQAESREKVFLLYRNMRRMLTASGCGERLNCSDENTAEFNRLLEQCSFGEKEPTPEELQAAGAFCEALAKEVYTALPFYKKPLFLGLNVYGFGR
ncbi:MAG: transglutaminaseTgpA domain-containing protein [Acetatifactor muris]|nr:transglutaminaseTgpA domain-containing protein [Acetatifactor muris]